MDKEPAPTKYDGELSVQYNSARAVMEFFYQGEKVYCKTIPQCENIFPHIVWYSIRQRLHVRYVL